MIGRIRTLYALAGVVAAVGGGACAAEESETLPTLGTNRDADAAVVTTPPIGTDAASGIQTNDGRVADAGPAKPTRVPIFIAQGKLGRTTVSCDDGHTWIADHSEDPVARCWDDTAAKNVECDHNAWSSLGMVEADGVVLASYGWGYPGVVRRTEDGIHWEDVLPGHTFAGMAFGNGRVVANDRAPWISTAAGATGTWTQGGDIASPVWNVRRIGFVPDGGGRFVISLESGPDSDIVLSDDNGAHWHAATTRPPECGKSVSGLLHGNGVTLMVQTNGSVCRSTDRGDTWTHVPVASYFGSASLFADGAFVVWEGSTRHRSTDGTTWTSDVGTAGVAIGAVARASNGTFVAVRDGWQVWYEKQQFYRSTDGINWEILAPTAFNPSHPITHIIATWAKPSAECPLH